MDFQNSPPFKILVCFYVTPVETLNVFNTWKMKTFLKNLEDHFLVENTKIENASFSYKSVMSEANVKTNRMVSTK